MNICEHLTAVARLLPEKDAIRFEGASWTYGELDRLSAAAAERLADFGVNRSDRVALMLPNVPAFAVWYYGVLRLGGVPVSISTRLVSEEVGHIVRDCEPVALVTASGASSNLASGEDAHLGAVLEASECGRHCNNTDLATDEAGARSTWENTEPDDPALILYTSGTTGYPKGATLSHRNVRTNVDAFNHLCGMRPADRILLAVPLFHCFGQNALLNSALNVGATLVMQRVFEPSATKRLIQEEQVTQLYGVPTMFQLLHECCSPEELSSVHYCFSAAAPLPVEAAERWQEKFGLPIHEGYGLTETSPFASYNHRVLHRNGSIGAPIDGVEMKIVDSESGAECPPGELGEIVIRGPNVMLGYWNRPDATAEAIRDGWFHSGDIGRQDESGLFSIVDRLKDMISVGGLKVYPAEVERVLRELDGVSDAAVVGVPDKLLGEQVVAFVVLGSTDNRDRNDAAEAIQREAHERLAAYKTPTAVLVVDELPRNPSGKVLKTVLRERAQSRFVEGGLVPRDNSAVTGLRELLAAAHPNARSAAAARYLQELVSSLTQSESYPDPEAGFLDLGLDSLLIVEMSNRLQAELGPGVDVPPTLVFDYPRLMDLAGFLVASLHGEDPGVQPNGRQASPAKPTAGMLASTAADLRSEIEGMTDAEADDALLRELESMG
ncbi:MAG: AMP-binding protein [Planctomycetota bacterium]